MQKLTTKFAGQYRGRLEQFRTHVVSKRHPRCIYYMSKASSILSYCSMQCCCVGASPWSQPGPLSFITWVPSTHGPPTIVVLIIDLLRGNPHPFSSWIYMQNWCTLMVIIHNFGGYIESQMLISEGSCAVCSAPAILFSTKIVLFWHITRSLKQLHWALLYALFWGKLTVNSGNTVSLQWRLFACVRLIYVPLCCCIQVKENAKQNKDFIAGPGNVMHLSPAVQKIMNAMIEVRLAQAAQLNRAQGGQGGLSDEDKEELARSEATIQALNKEVQQVRLDSDVCTNKPFKAKYYCKTRIFLLSCPTIVSSLWTTCNKAPTGGCYHFRIKASSRNWSLASIHAYCFTLF